MCTFWIWVWNGRKLGLLFSSAGTLDVTDAPGINADIELRQKIRTRQLRGYCEKFNLPRGRPTAADFYHLLVDQKHKVIYCYVPKVGCTQWLKIMGTLKGLPDRIVNPDPRSRRDSYEHDKIHERGLFKYLDSFPAREAQRMLQEYTTFFFVREPFERLLSAYRDKFTQTYWPKAHYRVLASEIIKKVRPSATKVSLDSGLGLTFDEFTRYMATTSTSEWDHHWGLYDDICRPCKINYDFIGHFEDMEEEGPYVLKRAGIDHLVSGNFRPSNTSSHLKAFFSHIPKERILKIVEKSRSNFEMFGYSFPGALKEFFVNSTISKS